MSVATNIQKCHDCPLSLLPINSQKPVDSQRTNRKLLFLSQNPSNNRKTDGKIFEEDNVSDRVMNSFFRYLSLTRDDCYFSNILKCSTLGNETPDKSYLDICIKHFYDEVDEIRPILIVAISKFAYLSLDKSKLKPPIVQLNHPSYYYRQTGDEDKAARMMYEDLKKKTLDSSIKYNISIDFVEKTIKFKTEDALIGFFQNINNMKVYNIAIDAHYIPVLIFVSNKKIFRVQFNYHNYCYVECPEEKSEKYTLTGIPVKRYFYRKKDDLYGLKTYEADIHSDYRFIIDYANYFDCPAENDINYMTFDIETNKSVDVIGTNEEIISIVYLKNGITEFLMLDNGQNNFDELRAKRDVRIFTSEKEMIRYFARVFRTSNLVTGFNIKGFDLIYLFNRAKKLGINESEFSPISRVKNLVIEEKDRMDEMKIGVYGLDCIDTMIFAKNKFFIFSLDKPSQYNLDYLGKFLNLGEKVHDSRGPSVLWKEDPVKLYEYNIQDVVLCRKIEEYMSMFNFLRSFKLLMSTFNITFSMYNSKIIDFYILTHYSDKYAFPSKTQHAETTMEGAYVMEPIAEVYDNIAIYDFTGLYPNLIRQFNLSYETVSKDTSKHPIGNEYFVDMSKKGLLPKIVDELMFMKDDIKDQMNKSSDDTLLIKYNAIKTVINGLYGVFKYRYFRMYHYGVASSITYLGRNIIQKTRDEVNKNENFKVVYQDTDSNFVSLKKEATYDEAKAIFLEYEPHLKIIVNNIIKDDYHLENQYLHMECETIFERLLLTQAKKKYYGYGNYFKGKHLKQSKEYGRGIDLVKKDTPLSLRPLIKESLMTLITERDFKIQKAKIRSIKDKIKSLNYRDLLITKQISRELDEYKVVPQHVKAMLYSNKYLGTDFSRANYKGGMLMVKVKSRKYPDTEVIMLAENTELPPEIVVDYDKYYNLFIKNKIELYLDRFKMIFSDHQPLSTWFE